MEHIPGPDFPTAAIINGRRGIEAASLPYRSYKVYTAPARKVEADAKTGRAIIVHEIPIR